MLNLSGMTFGAIVMVTLLIWGYYILRSERTKVTVKMEDAERAMVEKHCPELLMKILFAFRTPTGEFSPEYTPVIRNALMDAFGWQALEYASEAVRDGKTTMLISGKKKHNPRPGESIYDDKWFYACFAGTRYVSGCYTEVWGGKSGM